MSTPESRLASHLDTFRFLVDHPQGQTVKDTVIALIYEAWTGKKVTKPISGLRTGDRYLDKVLVAIHETPESDNPPLAALTYLVQYSEVLKGLSDAEIARIAEWMLAPGRRLATKIPARALVNAGRLPGDLGRQLALFAGMATEMGQPAVPMPPSAKPVQSPPSIPIGAEEFDLSGFSADPNQVRRGRQEIAASYGSAGPGPVYISKAPSRVTVQSIPEPSESQLAEIEARIAKRLKGV